MSAATLLGGSPAFLVENSGLGVSGGVSIVNPTAQQTGCFAVVSGTANARLGVTNATTTAGVSYFVDEPPTTSNDVAQFSATTTHAGGTTQTIWRTLPQGAYPYASYQWDCPSLNTSTATIAAGTSSIAVPNTGITANSVVLFSVEQALPDATATTFAVSKGAGVGFTISANANATAAVVLRWVILKY